MSIPQTGGGPIEHSDQLAEYLAAGCKPRAAWRIGTEHEKFGYCKQSLKPIPYDGKASIFAVLDGLRQRHGWAPVEEAGAGDTNIFASDGTGGRGGQTDRSNQRWGQCVA